MKAFKLLNVIIKMAILQYPRFGLYESLTVDIIDPHSKPFWRAVNKFEDNISVTDIVRNHNRRTKNIDVVAKIRTFAYGLTTPSL